MLSRKYFISLTATALLLISGAIVYAQTAPVRGTVMIKKADGTSVPAANAVIDVYRIDAKGKLPSGKTDKKGVFAFAGLPFGQKFAFAISGPGIQSNVFPNIIAGADLNLNVSEGDGKPLTEAEVLQALTVKPAQGGGQPPAEMSAEDKKKQAEYEKQIAEANAKNEKIKNSNEIIKKDLDEGRAAFDAKNYDLAISKFDEGINADPEFEGSAPVLLNNKSLALRLRGFDAYKQSRTDTANKETLMAKAKSDFTTSIDASEKSLAILKKATTTDSGMQKSFDANKYNALANEVECYRLLIATKADQTPIKEAVAALTAYEAVETNAPQKVKVQTSMANALRMSGNSADALPIYRRALEVAPDNADAIGGAGLSLFDVGVSATNKEQMQEGLNLMEKFTQVAPVKADDTAEMKEFKASVKDAVDYLKNQEKLVPQKVTTPAKKRT